MRIDILTTFPEMVDVPLQSSLMGRAREAGLLDVRVQNLRDFTRDKHRSTDDEQYGGGEGMVMSALPVIEAVESLAQTPPPPRVIFFSPQGPLFTQAKAESYAREQRLLFVCGHYKGIDERALEVLNAEELSIGDYVLTGGELPAVIVVDAVARLLPGVVGSMSSVMGDSFSSGLLDSPRYTRPREVRGRTVPDVLLSGNHENIARWRHEQALERTQARRPDIYRRWLESQAGSGDEGTESKKPTDV